MLPVIAATVGDMKYRDNGGEYTELLFPQEHPSWTTFLLSPGTISPLSGTPRQTQTYTSGQTNVHTVRPGMDPYVFVLVCLLPSKQQTNKDINCGQRAAGQSLGKGVIMENKELMWVNNRVITSCHVSNNQQFVPRSRLNESCQKLVGWISGVQNRRWLLWLH